MLTDYADHPDLLLDLENAKTEFYKHYQQHYAARSCPKAISDVASDSAGTNTSSSKSFQFVSRYGRRDRHAINELDEYFKIAPEDFVSCNPLEWWWTRRGQFPNLYRLAGDILSIPGVLGLNCSLSNLTDLGATLGVLIGSAVAVERIFSGGRDTISLRRASLQPSTIRILMLLKHRLRLARLRQP